MFRTYVTLCSVLLLGCATARPKAITGPAWLEETGPQPALEGRHVVFVAGFMNDVIPGYFDDIHPRALS